MSGEDNETAALKARIVELQDMLKKRVVRTVLPHSLGRRDKEIAELKERIAELEAQSRTYTPVWDRLRQIADELEDDKNAASEGDEW
jgi:hypothetical protein